MFYDKIQICEDHLIDLSNDEFEGCPVCEMQKEINRLKKIIKAFKTPPEPTASGDTYSLASLRKMGAGYYDSTGFRKF